MVDIETIEREREKERVYVKKKREKALESGKMFERVCACQQV